jgi:hypothetical protein
MRLSIDISVFVSVAFARRFSDAFLPLPEVRPLVASPHHPARASFSLWASGAFDEAPLNIWRQREEKSRRQSLIKTKLALSDDLVNLRLVGQASLPTMSLDRLQTCLVLSPNISGGSISSRSMNTPTEALPALLVPIDGANPMRLVEAAAAGSKLSLPVLLRLNMIAVNRDDGLFDNLPWAAWTIDPQYRLRDAAGSAVAAQYLPGKRDAYNVLLGKDWQGSPSRALSSLAYQLRQQLSRNDESIDQDDAQTLATRMLELQIRDLRMDLAECDYQLAIARTNEGGDSLPMREKEQQGLTSKIQLQQARLQAWMQSPGSVGLIEKMLAGMEEAETDVQAPYFGASGYAPQRGNGKDEEEIVYKSPYDMFKSIVKDQLKAEVIGTLLENTSLLEGTTALGGVLVLRRLTAVKTATVAGESLSISDEDEDYGNENVLGGELLVVECDSDEAVGMSLACDLPLQIEEGIWERSSLMVKAAAPIDRSNKLASWQSVDPELSVLMEGQAGNQSATERVAPVRKSRSTQSLFTTLLQSPTATSKELFPTDNPIQSLSALDRQSNEEKARTLMSMSNFEGRLPRQRVVKESEKANGGVNALDQLLIPRIDESVRREFYIRQAVQVGDLDLARELESSKSMRQITREKAEQAKNTGDEDVAAYWEREANLYASLRADVTQDEGSYTRFLDRDEWYERDRLKTAARVDRKKFGTLLDGVE